MSKLAESLQPIKYSEYRNTRLNMALLLIAPTLTWIVELMAMLYCISRIDYLASTACMFGYYLICRMPDQSIYFTDNKGIGPGWKYIFFEDIGHSFRRAFGLLGASIIVRIFAG